jgi:hypothetical protein
MNTEIILEEYTKQFEAVQKTTLAKSNTKEKFTELVEEIASSLQLMKKDGITLDLGKVKKPSLNGAIELLNGGPNKLKEALELQEEYLKLLKTDTSIIHKLKVLSGAKSAEKDQKSEEKDVFAQTLTMVDKDTGKAIKEAVNIEVKTIEKQNKGKDVKTGSDLSLVNNIIKIVKEAKKQG